MAMGPARPTGHQQVLRTVLQTGRPRRVLLPHPPIALRVGYLHRRVLLPHHPIVLRVGSLHRVPPHPISLRVEAAAWEVEAEAEVGEEAVAGDANYRIL